MGKFYTWPVAGSYGKEQYVVKEIGVKEAMCKMCGHGEEAKVNGEKIAQALNDAPALDIFVRALKDKVRTEKELSKALTGAVEMLKHIKTGGTYDALDYISRLCEYETVLEQFAPVESL